MAPSILQACSTHSPKLRQARVLRRSDHPGTPRWTCPRPGHPSSQQASSKPSKLVTSEHQLLILLDAMLPDIMCMILGMLDVSSLAQLGATSRQFRDLCAAPDLWRTLLANAASCALKQQIHIRQLQSVARADVLAMLAPGWQSSCAVHVTISHSHGKHMTNEPQAHIRDSPFHTFLSSTPHASSLVSRAPLRTRLPLTQIPSTHGLAHTHTHTRWGSPG
eukprot:3622023-Pleurochrysis_carterae.AAC.1